MSVALNQAHRIVLGPEEVRSNHVLLSRDNTHHVREVLRLRHGGAVRGLVPATGEPSGEGYDLVLRIEEMRSGRLACSIEGRVELGSEPALAVTVCQGLTRSERFEYAVQKCTEIGAWGFRPVITARSIIRLDASRCNQRLGRWRRIAEEAALQSGRARIPEVSDIVRLGELCDLARVSPAQLMLVAYEEETTPLREVLRRATADARPQTAAVVVGPEGGLERGEVEQLAAAGFIPVSLGPRILRTETAGPVILSLLLYELADLGGAVVG